MAKILLPGNVEVSGLPDDTTAEQAMVYLKNANPEAYRRVLNATATTQAQFEEPTAWESFGRGATDIATGAGQLVGLLPGVESQLGNVQQALSYIPGGTAAGTVPERTPEQAEAQEAADVGVYERGAGPGIDWPRLGGQAAALAPLAAVPMSTPGLVGRTITGGLTGALGGATVYAGSPEERLANTGYGLMGGGLFGAAAPALAAGAGRVAGAISAPFRRAAAGAAPLSQEITLELTEAAGRQGVALSELSDAAQEALARRARTAFQMGDLDPDALVRQARIESAGFTGEAAPMRGQATRDPRQYGTEWNLSRSTEGPGVGIGQRYQHQAQRASDILEGRLAQFGDEPSALDPTTVGEAVEAAAQERARSTQQAVGELYRVAEEARPDMALDLAPLREGINRLRETRSFDILPSDVQQRIQNMVSASGKATPRQLNNLRETLGSARTHDPGRNSLIKEMQGLIDETLDAAPEFAEELRAARGAARERFEMIGPETGLTGRLASQTRAFEPDRVVPQLMRGPVKQAERLKSFIAETNPQAWEQVQASTLNDIIEYAKDASGAFSQSKFNNRLKQIGQRRLANIFGAEGAEELQAFGSAVRDLFSLPAGHTANISQSGIMATQAGRNLIGSVLERIPGARFVGLSPEAIAARNAATAQARFVSEAIQPPLEALPPIDPILPLVRAASPAAGLLATQATPRRR